MKTTHARHKAPKNAFTLIELLIVISIIAVLAAVSFPVMGAVMNQAKRVTALNECQNIANAVKAYQSEYNRMPLRSEGGGSDSQIFQSDASFMKILTGEDEEMNKRKHRFYEGKQSKGSINGMDKQGNLWDPWGEHYQIEVDANYDGYVTGPPGADGPLRQDTAVWSYGKPKRNGQRAEYKKWVKSFE